MKAKVLTFLAALALSVGAKWITDGNKAVSDSPPALAFRYSEQPLTMGNDVGTGIFIRIDVTVASGQTAVIEWTPVAGLPFLPVHEIKAPFAFATDEMWSRFVVSNDVLGLYRVVAR